MSMHQNPLLGCARSVAHVSVILDVLRARFPGHTFGASDSGLIRLIAASPQSIPSAMVIAEMGCVCDGASEACYLLESKIRLHGGKL